MLVSLSVVVSVLVPYNLAVFFVGFLLFAWQVVILDRTNLEVKRYTNQALGPVLTNLGETIDGRKLVKVMRFNNFFSRRQQRFVDRFVGNQFFSNAVMNWGMLLTAFISFVLALSCSLIIVSLQDELGETQVGLALTYSFLIPYFLSIMSIIVPMLVAAATSLERVLEYRMLPQEPDWHIDSVDDKLSDTKEESSWPAVGEIVFENVEMVYRPGLPPALSDVNVRFEGGKKVGVVGRTGAGKSSLTLLLFRVYETSKGRILIDGTDISTMGLQLLRSSIVSIPQEPLLLRGNVKRNLDPFEKHTDEELAVALSKVGLSLSLLESDESAFNLSIGQRQVRICQ